MLSLESALQSQTEERNLNNPQHGSEQLNYLSAYVMKSNIWLMKERHGLGAVDKASPYV